LFLLLLKFDSLCFLFSFLQVSEQVGQAAEYSWQKVSEVTSSTAESVSKLAHQFEGNSSASEDQPTEEAGKPMNV
jgi:hypothetical protein